MELIDQETAKIEEVIEKVESMTPEQFYRFIMAVCGAYLRQDAAPVVHGRWEWHEERNGTPIDGYDYSWAWRCSHCKTNLPDNYDDPNDSPQIHYCSRCGAKMDGDEGHG